MKILFMGTPEFAKKSLKSLHENGHEILGVVTNIDKPKGRGMQVIATPVKEYALAKNLKVYQPEKIKGNTDFITEIKAMNPEVIVVVAYGKILPKEILDIPKYGCINVHGSILPKYRGAAPIQWAILNGDKTTGVTTMYMDVGIDTGDMILKREVDIGEDETTGELFEKLADVGAELLLETLKQIQAGTAKREKQGDNYTITSMLNKEMAGIKWEEQTAKEIKNLVRGLNPMMGAYSFLNNKKYKFWKVRVVENVELFKIVEGLEEFKTRLKDVEAGTIIYVDAKKGLYVKAKDDVISVLEIQGENAKKMEISEFLRGNKLLALEKFH